MFLAVLIGILIKVSKSRLEATEIFEASKTVPLFIFQYINF